MPGVPTSRGCDSCRQAKKKCDLGKPACGRCTRLRNPCTGAGTQRFKFVPSKAVPSRAAFDPTAVRRRHPPNPYPLAVVGASPSDHLAAGLVYRLEVTDVRYDIAAYGSFFRFLPQRVGANKALDAAVDVFSAAFTISHDEQQNSFSSFRVLMKYANAISAVRACVENPTGTSVVETVCAIYLILLVQMWLGQKDETMLVTHEEGMAQLLDIIASRGVHDEFEACVFAGITVPVVFGSMCNERIQLTPRVWQTLDMLAPRPASPSVESPGTPSESVHEYPSLHFWSMVRYPSFLRHPERYYAEIVSSYSVIKEDLLRLESKVESLSSTSLDTLEPSSKELRRRRDYQAACGMALASALIISQILYAYSPESAGWEEDSALFVQKIISVSEDASNFQPIGAGFMGGPLSAAWAASEDEAQRERIKVLRREIGGSFRGEDLGKMSRWWYYKYMALRCKGGRLKPGDDAKTAQRETSKVVSCVQCSASHNYIELSFD